MINNIRRKISAINYMMAVKDSIKCIEDIDVIKSLFKVIDNDVYPFSNIVFTYFTRHLNGSEREKLIFDTWVLRVAKNKHII
jgi:hypothetical protein